MDNFLTISDFTSFIELPETDTDDTSFVAFVAERQKYYLTKLLGQRLYNAFEIGLVGTEIPPVLPETEPTIVIEPKWLDLRDGANFTAKDINGVEITLHWEGMVNLLKYLIYFDYVISKNFSSTKLGTVRAETNAASKIEIPQIIYNQYNRGLDLYGNEIIEFCESPQFGKPYRNFNNLQRVNYSLFYEILYNALVTPSAFNFLFRNKAVYENWFYTQIDKQNKLGI